MTRQPHLRTLCPGLLLAALVLLPAVAAQGPADKEPLGWKPHVIRRGDGKGGWVLRAYYNPLVPWVWFGAVLAAFGGIVSLSDRRSRMRAPATRVMPRLAPRPADPG